MTRVIFTYGIIAGLIVVAAMTVGYTLSLNGAASSSVLFGFATMFVALSLIFVGIKNFRDKHHGGVIKFLPAFLVGLGISSVAGVIYVLGWEAHLGVTDYAFIHDYTAKIIEDKQAAGVSGEALEKLKSEMAAMIKNYGNPLYRMPMTFLEIFPVGLLISLISAALLRNPKVMPAR